MTVRVFYHSLTGNTRMIADAIAGTAGCTAEPVAAAAVTEPVDMLFLGAAVHGGDVDASVKKFIEGLDPALVKQVAVFSTGFSESRDKAVGIINSLLVRRGVATSDKRYFCKGKFLLFNRKSPDGQDLKGAEEFARSVLTG